MAAGTPSSTAAAVTVVFTDGSVFYVSLARGGEQQGNPAATRLATGEFDSSVAAAAAASSGGDLAVVTSNAAGEVFAHTHHVEVRY